MNNSIIKLLAETGEEDSGLVVLLAVIIFILFAALLFIYLASCIIIVKQGTRKIVERFGSYNRTLKEGIHVIFRPFDRIAPVPWNILSISERDKFEKNMSHETIPFFNDDDRVGARRSNTDVRRLERKRELIRRRLERDIRLQMREKFIDNSENVSEAYADTMDINKICMNASGRNVAELVNDVIESEHAISALEKTYKELGLDAYRADPDLVNALIEQDRENDAVAASVKYYPRHQDPHSRRRGLYPMAEPHVQDFVDMRERHIDTSNERVRKLFALKLESDLFFPKYDSFAGDQKVLNSGTRFSGVNLITKDNASIGANIVIFFSVTDPFLYYYGVDEPEESLVLLAITTLRNIVSGLTLEEALQARAEINKQIRQELDIATNNWGIKANRVEVKEFELGFSMQKAMDDVLIAEREKRANILRAEGYRKMKDEQVMGEHLKLKGYETLQEVSRGPANKVFIPNDLSDFITGAHVVADAFKDAKKEKPAGEEENK